jgi:hypothetical protein
MTSSSKNIKINRINKRNKLCEGCVCEGVSRGFPLDSQQGSGFQLFPVPLASFLRLRLTSRVMLSEKLVQMSSKISIADIEPRFC